MSNRRMFAAGRMVQREDGFGRTYTVQLAEDYDLDACSCDDPCQCPICDVCGQRHLTEEHDPIARGWA